MPKKRCLPKSFHAESPKKRLRRRTPSEDRETSPNAQTLKEAQNILRKSEKENIELRVERVEKTVNRAILFIGRDLRKHNETLGQKIIRKYQKKSVRFPVNYNACMGFIDGYTGVKKRTEATICWDEKESKNWLNRQRANVYGPTLFKEALDFVDAMSYEIAQANTTHSRHLRRMGICKLLVELLRVNYKPKSKQAAEKRLICANSVKHKTFRNRLIRLVGWQDITKTTTLESVAERAEKEYQALLASYGASQPNRDEMSADEAEESDDDDQSSEDDEEDAEMEEDDSLKIATKRSHSTDEDIAIISHSGSPPRDLLLPSLIPKIQMDRDNGTFVPPPVNSLDTSTMPSLIASRPIHLPQMSVVPASTFRMNPVAAEGVPTSTTGWLQQRVSDLEKEVVHLKYEVLKHRARMESWAQFVPPQLRNDLCPEVLGASEDVRMTAAEPTCTVPALPLPQPSVMGPFGVPSNWLEAYESLSTMGSIASDAMTEHSAVDGNDSWAVGIGPP